MTKGFGNLDCAPLACNGMLYDIIGSSLRDLNLALGEKLVDVFSNIRLLFNARYILDSPFLRYKRGDALTLLLSLFLPARHDVIPVSVGLAGVS